MDVNEEKLERKSLYGPAILFAGGQNAVVIHKEVIRALGTPEYISLWISRDRKSVAITASTQKHPLSFRVPENFLRPLPRKRFRIYSMGFSTEIRRSWRLKNGKSYTVKGNYDPQKKAVVFCEDAVEELLSQGAEVVEFD